MKPDEERCARDQNRDTGSPPQDDLIQNDKNIKFNLLSLALSKTKFTTKLK